MRGTVKAAGIAVAVGFITSGFVGQAEQVFRMLQILCRPVRTSFQCTGAGCQCCGHFTTDGGICSAQCGACLLIVGTVVFHAVFQQFHRPPPGVIHLSVANLVNGSVAFITGS